MKFINKINLSYSSLVYAINICQEKEGYMVGIATDDDISYEKAKDFLIKIVKDWDDVESINNSYASNFHIYFKNGSFIKFICTNGNARMQRFNLLIADENISDDVMRYIVLPCFIPYYWEEDHEYK